MATCASFQDLAVTIGRRVKRLKLVLHRFFKNIVDGYLCFVPGSCGHHVKTG